MLSWGRASTVIGEGSRTSKRGITLLTFPAGSGVVTEQVRGLGLFTPVVDRPLSQRSLWRMRPGRRSLCSLAPLGLNHGSGRCFLCLLCLSSQPRHVLKGQLHTVGCCCLLFAEMVLGFVSIFSGEIVTKLLTLLAAPCCSL